MKLVLILYLNLAYGDITAKKRLQNRSKTRHTQFIYSQECSLNGRYGNDEQNKSCGLRLNFSPVEMYY